MPGNCGIVISTNAYTGCDFRNKGINTIMNKFRLKLAKKLRYSRIMATVIKRNEYEISTLIKNGWKEMGSEFTNCRTENKILTFYKDL